MFLRALKNLSHNEALSVMKIEIQSVKLTLKWWQLALIIAVIILSIKAPELVVKLLQLRFSSG
jgi:hypothetical protein